MSFVLQGFIHHITQNICPQGPADECEAQTGGGAAEVQGPDKGSWELLQWLQTSFLGGESLWGSANPAVRQRPTVSLKGTVSSALDS